MENLKILEALPEMAGKRIYLAVPYTHARPEIMAERYCRVTLFLRQAMNNGLQIYSPITYGHFLENNWNIRQSYDYWITHCLSMLERWATDIFVYMINGWQESRGVKLEIETARSLGLPVWGINPLELLRGFQNGEKLS